MVILDLCLNYEWFVKNQIYAAISVEVRVKVKVQDYSQGQILVTPYCTLNRDLHDHLISILFLVVIVIRSRMR